MCCIEGDAGAPVEESEVATLKALLPVVWERLADRAKEVIAQQGLCYVDEEGDTVISLVDGRECVFSTIDEQGICKCVIEQAYLAGETDFYKPISCHLYPVREHKYRNYVALDYHRWKVCACAGALGRQRKLPLYKFLEKPLVRRFGKEWYAQMEIAEKELQHEKASKGRNHNHRR